MDCGAPRQPKHSHTWPWSPTCWQYAQPVLTPRHIVSQCVCSMLHEFVLGNSCSTSIIPKYKLLLVSGTPFTKSQVTVPGHLNTIPWVQSFVPWYPQYH